MGLHWDVTNCNNSATLLEEESGEWAITNALIWLTIGVDQGVISETNIGEFYARVKVWELVSGAFITKTNSETDKLEDYFITFGDIQKRIGLNTNVSNVPLTAWLKRIDLANQNINGKTKLISKNKIKAVYYSAISEIEEYTASTNDN
jgi:hypothetical protein